MLEESIETSDFFVKILRPILRPLRIIGAIRYNDGMIDKININEADVSLLTTLPGLGLPWLPKLLPFEKRFIHFQR